MGKWTESFLEGLDVFFAWLSTAVKQTTESYCELETADSQTSLVMHDGTLVSIIQLDGFFGLVGEDEFATLCAGITNALQAIMGHAGQAFQVLFSYDKQSIKKVIDDVYAPARATQQRLDLKLDDLFDERSRTMSRYCSDEHVYIVLFTRPFVLTKEQSKEAFKQKLKTIRENKLPPFNNSQTVYAAIPEIRDAHEAFIVSVMNDFVALNLKVTLLNVHDAIYAIRKSADPEFTADDWRATLPGDKLPVRIVNDLEGDISDILWPSIARQVIPRDAEVLDRKSVLVGDRMYSCVYIDLFPKDIRSFTTLLYRVLPSQTPWRISFLVESDGLPTVKLKGMLAGILSFTSSQNRLLSDSVNLLKYIDINTDEDLVRLRVVATTWAPEGEISLLRSRTSELSKAIQGWGSTEVSEICGDPFGGFVATMPATTFDSPAIPTVAPLSAVVSMLPICRPSSPWTQGAMLFRTPDGKLWPFQPGSAEQTTWIDLVYARPGSGKSVLSNDLNLALCLSGGLARLPRIAIIDIGPSSSGLISLIKESLPVSKRHFAAYFRLRMTPEYSINPFDTQLGARYPTALERSFLVNFLTLLATPVGALKPYDGITDLSGMVVDELYKFFCDDSNPNLYTTGIEEFIDGILQEISFVRDSKTTWWEVTDALFTAGFIHEAHLAQRYTAPLLADVASICRISSIEDLYGKIVAPTGETLINAFSRMISAAIREYPILSRITAFDIGDVRVVALDLDEVAKSGGDAANRQTCVMYMLARYVVARHYYLTEENMSNVPKIYSEYHKTRVTEIREDPKRIVYDEFHRTGKSAAVREQILIDMREGRKWKVQIALLSQAVDDFDSIMIDFATAIYIMDAGSSQAVDNTARIFGLSPTAKQLLKARVHGPRQGGGTFLAQFATKGGVTEQLLTLTLGPIELWAFSTTVEDTSVRNRLYTLLGPVEARRFLASLFPGGSVFKLVEQRMNSIKESGRVLTEEDHFSVIEDLVEDILLTYSHDPNSRSLIIKNR